MLTIFFLACLMLAGCAETRVDSNLPTPASLPPWPKVENVFVFRFRGATDEAVAKARTHPSYKVQDLPDGRVQVEWDPKVPKDWEVLRERFGGKHYPDFLYDCMAIKSRLGKTQYTGGGLGINGWGGTTFREVRGELTATMNFDDWTTHNNESMIINGVLGVSPEEVRHDMLSVFAEAAVRVEKCGDGYVFVRQDDAGTAVGWQVNDQVYVHIYNSYDREMVAAYVHRLGSTIPKDFEVNVDAWIRDEIRYRSMCIDWIIRTEGWASERLDGTNAWRAITVTFPDVYRMKGFLNWGASPAELYSKFRWVREWLWANKDNFKRRGGNGGFILKGPDRYDPAHPPELPEEMTHLPTPDYTPPEKPKEP